MATKLSFPSLKRGSKLVTYHDAVAFCRIVKAFFAFKPELQVRWDAYNVLTEEDYLSREIPPEDEEPMEFFVVIGGNNFNVALLASPFKFESIKTGMASILPVFQPGMSVAQFITNLPGTLEYINRKLDEMVSDAYRG